MYEVGPTEMDRSAFTSIITLASHGKWCVIPNYTKDGRFGYFVCQQEITGKAVIYSNVVCFVEKTSETSFNDAVRYLSMMVEQRPPLINTKQI